MELEKVVKYYSKWLSKIYSNVAMEEKAPVFCSFSFDDDAMHVHEPLEVCVEVLLVPVES